MSKRRITIETLAAGQPRPYADSLLHVRVTLEQDWNGKGYIPEKWSKEDVIQRLTVLNCGFPTKPPENWASPHLSWLKEISPGIWEFLVTEAYTD
jgi:hypothetical protein